MASKSEAEKVRFECPLCLDNFKNATILICGHTFCKECLEEYDEQHKDHDHLVCPVCRQSTKLGSGRVSGLTPNFSLKGVEDKLNVDHVDVVDETASYCSIHRTVYKDIFCVDCEIFICLSCYLDMHKEHKIIKKEELGRKLREKRDILSKKSNIMKAQIEKCLNDGKQDDKDIHRHLNNLEKNIKDKFLRKITILLENEELLLKSLDDIRKDTDDQSKRYLAHHRQLIDNIEISLEKLTDKIVESSDSNTLQAFYLQCREIENSLKQPIDIEPMVHLKQAVNTVKSTRFFPADEKLLALGHIEQGAKATASSMQDMKTATGLKQNVEEVQATSKIREIPASVTRNLNIVKKVVMPSTVTGIKRRSNDAVVVAYGMMGRNGADCFYVSGARKSHLRSEVGSVFDIALLPDGRSVVSHGKLGDYTLRVYDKQGNQIRGKIYTCPIGVRLPALCCDQHGNIYAVTKTQQVFIFHGKERKPKRVVPTGDIEPIQICVTKTGVMITSTCWHSPHKIRVIDREGHVGTTITSDDEYQFAAVDSHDRVFVARVHGPSDTIKLTMYTLQGTTLTKKVTFNPLKLDEPCQYIWSGIASLTPNMIALAQDYNLYFISIAD